MGRSSFATPSSGCPRCDPHRAGPASPAVLVIRAVWAALLGAVMVAVGASFDTASLYLPGLGLIIAGIGASLWVGLATRKLHVRRADGPHTVEEDEPYPLRLELEPGLVPPPAGELRNPLVPDPIPLGGRASRRIRIDVRFSRRGRRLFEPGVLVVHDPLRIVVREVDVGGEHGEVLVLPRIEPVLAARPDAAGGAGSGLDGGGEHEGLRGRMDGSSAELDLDGLRPYRPGTPASRIHWPAVARTGQMVERRLTAEADSAPLVVLDAARPPSEEALDRAVRAAASLCLHLAQRGGCALLLPGDRRPVSVAADLAAWPRLHARLALVEASLKAPALMRARRGGAVLWVSAAGAAPRELPRSAGGGAWLVTAEERPGARAVFSVAGCSGYRLGRRARPSTSAPQAGAAA